VIARGGQPFEPPRVFYFRAAPEAVGALTAAGIDFVSLANNHAMDFGGSALLETIDHLDRSGIAHAGGGRDLADSSRPALLESGGLKIGVVAFADHFAEYGAAEDRPGTNVIRIDASAKEFARVRQAIRSARESGADLVVFSIHWGPNMREAPSAEFVAFAHAVIDAGADVFHGHSAHLFQGIEIHHGKPIFYDTGDLIDDYAVDPRLRNDRQLLFVLTVGRDGVRRIELFPLRIRHMRVERAGGEDFAAIEERVRRSSRAFGTTIRREGDRLVAAGGG
jgi:poly-gamma-glutamate synthesis protein (capsule biosynthesis protein)